MNEYAYKMEGLDKDWTFLKSNRKVYYTKLAPGNYIFKVKGSNSSGVWNNTGSQTLIYEFILPGGKASGPIFYMPMIFAGIAYLLIKNYLQPGS